MRPGGAPGLGDDERFIARQGLRGDGGARHVCQPVRAGNEKSEAGDAGGDREEGWKCVPGEDADVQHRRGDSEEALPAARWRISRQNEVLYVVHGIVFFFIIVYVFFFCQFTFLGVCGAASKQTIYIYMYFLSFLKLPSIATVHARHESSERLVGRPSLHLEVGAFSLFALAALELRSGGS